MAKPSDPNAGVNIAQANIGYVRSGHDKIRLVLQPNGNSGCGPACVAMVAGVTFDEAVLAMWGYPVKRGFFSYYADLKVALAQLNIEHAPRAVRSTSFAQARELSIFACQRRANGNWHFVLWDPVKSRLYDPLKPKRLKLPVELLDRRYRPFSRLAIPHRRSIAR